MRRHCGVAPEVNVSQGNLATSLSNVAHDVGVEVLSHPVSSSNLLRSKCARNQLQVCQEEFEDAEDQRDHYGWHN
jgi:hypothetical protein